MDTLGPILIPIGDVVRCTSLSRPTVYARIKNGTFPSPRKAGKRSLWLLTDIEAWAKALPTAESGK